MSLFKFEGKWKEELIVTGSGGSFVLELPMGQLTAFLPTESEWKLKSPLWARDLYPQLKTELEIWCKEANAEFVIDASAQVYEITLP